MASDLFSNNATITVSAGGVTAPSALTTETWTVASSAAFPAANNASHPATQFRIVDPSLPSEVILVTNVSGITWSVTRGWEGTSPVAHTAGFNVSQIISADFLNGLQGHGAFFNVLAYGADPTGASDSLAAIQAAMTDCATAGGGTVLIPKGSFKLSGTILVGAETTVYAYGAYIFPAAGNYPLLWNYPGGSPTVYTAPGNITIMGGVWDNKGQTFTSGTSDTIFFCHASNIVCQDMTLRNTQSLVHAIEFNAINGGQIINCRSEGANKGTGIANFEAFSINAAVAGQGQLATDNTMSKDILVQGCYVGPAIDGSGLNSHGWAVGTHSSQGNQLYHNIRILGNTADTCLYGGIHGYCFSESVVSNNIVINCAGPGILMDPQSGGTFFMQRLTVSGNVVQNCTGAGISLNGVDASNHIANVSVTGNTVTNCTNGIAMNFVTGASVTGNYVDNSLAGIIFNNGNEIAATGNILSDGTFGIANSNSGHFNYSNNVINSASTNGILVNVAAASSGEISGNFILNSGIGVYSPNNTVQVLCSNNKIGQGGSGTQGIVVAGTSANWTVINNDVSNGTWTLANALSLVAGTVVTADGITGLRGDNYWNPTPLTPTPTLGSLSSFTTEAVVGTFAIPANDAVALGCYKYRFHGRVSVTGTPNFTFQVRLGGLSGPVLAIYGPTGAITASSGVTNRGWQIDGDLFCTLTGASATWLGNSTLNQQFSVSGGSGTPLYSQGGITQNSTINNNLVVTVSCSLSDPANIVNTLGGIIQRLY